ncbi:cobalamin-binding protein [Candidatus Thorarchaeota archaeon]|nr:MAG: cobalamin-binding protein [Candidatus Thorarchaeota archaeon]
MRCTKLTSDIFKELKTAVIKGKSDQARSAAKKALEEGIPPLEVISEGLAKGVREVGDQFGEGEVFLVELIASGKAMKAGVAELLPAIKSSKKEIETAGTVVLGTVEGDIHSIGKDIVGTMLEANGFEVINLGEDVPASAFIDKAKEHDADIIGLSALLTSSMLRQQEIIEAIRKSGLDNVKIMIGGAPTTKDWAQEIKADGWAGDAVTAANLAKELAKK